MLRPAPEIILFGRDKGVKEIAEKLGCCHIPDAACNEWGTPLVGSLFKIAQVEARHDVLAFVNADIVLFQDFADAIGQVVAEFEKFLVVGLKWKISVPPKLDFTLGWQGRLHEYALRTGQRHKPNGGTDYFVFTRGVYNIDFLPLAIGRYRWDLWLVWQALRQGIPVVDATDVVLALHQEHSRRPRRGDEVARNVRLTEKLPKRAPQDATWKLTIDGFKGK